MHGEYESCDWIESGIAFNRRSLHACLIVHHRTGMPHFADYNGGPLPLEDIFRIRREIQEANRSGHLHPNCKGCAHLQRKAWPETKSSFSFIGIAHYSHCNLACNYCFLQTEDPASFAAGFKPYSLLETIRACLDDGTIAQDAIIDWGGGEPTVYREFDDILEITLDRGAFHYVHTNGLRFPSRVRGHSKASNVHAICSVDAGFPETFEQMKKRDALELVWKNLAEYVRSGCQVTLKYIVKQENCSDEEIEAFVERAVASGIPNLITDIDYNFPQPTPEVIHGLAKLQHLAQRRHIFTRFGFTGDNFKIENNVAAQVQAAIAREQIGSIKTLLEGDGCVVGDRVDSSIEQYIVDLKQQIAALEKSRDQHARSLMGKLTQIFSR